MARRGRGGFDRQFFEQLGEDVTKAALKALKDGADLVVNEMKSRVPIKSGALQNSIRAIPLSKGRKYRIVADAKNEKGIAYGQFVEFDDRIKHPFMYPSYDEKRDEVKRLISDAIREACQRNAIER